MRRHDMGGNGALMLSAIILLAAVASGFMHPAMVAVMPGEGICLPSPSQWNLPREIAVPINVALTLLCSLWLVGINRRYNFIPTTSVIFSSLFLMMAGADPLLASGLSVSTLLMVVNLASVSLLFSQYGRWDVNPANIFLVATLFSVGSMVHYAFLFFIIVYACGAALLKTFHVREFVALVMGVIAPYWIVVGLGIVPLSSLHIPVPESIWQSVAPSAEMLWVIIAVVLTAIWLLLTVLKNAMTLYNASTAVRAYSSTLALPALSCIILMLIDWHNFMVYYQPLALFAGIEGGYLATSGHRSSGVVVYWSVAVVYIFLIISECIGAQNL